MEDRQVPDDFPRDSRLGAVTGAQPKLLAREVDGRYLTGLTNEELWVRYDACDDLAAQLSDYAARKMLTAGLSRDAALSRAEKGVKRKVDAGEWDFSYAEVDWVMKRTQQLLPRESDSPPVHLPR